MASRSPGLPRGPIRNAADWLRANYEDCPQHNVPRALIYEQYSQYFVSQQLDFQNQANFGKVVHQVFPHVTARRLGNRGDSKYHYCGIRMRAEARAEIDIKPDVDALMSAYANHGSLLYSLPPPPPVPQPPHPSSHAFYGQQQPAAAASSSSFAAMGGGPGGPHHHPSTPARATYASSSPSSPSPSRGHKPSPTRQPGGAGPKSSPKPARQQPVEGPVSARERMTVSTPRHSSNQFGFQTQRMVPADLALRGALSSPRGPAAGATAARSKSSTASSAAKQRPVTSSGGAPNAAAAARQRLTGSLGSARPRSSSGGGTHTPPRLTGSGGRWAQPMDTSGGNSSKPAVSGPSKLAKSSPSVLENNSQQEKKASAQRTKSSTPVKSELLRPTVSSAAKAVGSKKHGGSPASRGTGSGSSSRAAVASVKHESAEARASSSGSARGGGLRASGVRGSGGAMVVLGHSSNSNSTSNALAMSGAGQSASPGSSRGHSLQNSGVTGGSGLYFHPQPTDPEGEGLLLSSGIDSPQQMQVDDWMTGELKSFESVANEANALLPLLPALGHNQTGGNHPLAGGGGGLFLDGYMFSPRSADPLGRPFHDDPYDDYSACSTPMQAQPPMTPMSPYPSSSSGGVDQPPPLLSDLTAALGPPPPDLELLSISTPTTFYAPSSPALSSSRHHADSEEDGDDVQLRSVEELLKSRSATNEMPSVDEMLAVATGRNHHHHQQQQEQQEQIAVTEYSDADVIDLPAPERSAFSSVGGGMRSSGLRTSSASIHSSTGHGAQQQQLRASSATNGLRTSSSGAAKAQQQQQAHHLQQQQQQQQQHGNHTSAGAHNGLRMSALTNSHHHHQLQQQQQQPQHQQLKTSGGASLRASSASSGGSNGSSSKSGSSLRTSSASVAASSASSVDPLLLLGSSGSRPRPVNNKPAASASRETVAAVQPPPQRGGMMSVADMLAAATQPHAGALSSRSSRPQQQAPGGSVSSPKLLMRAGAASAARPSSAAAAVSRGAARVAPPSSRPASAGAAGSGGKRGRDESVPQPPQPPMSVMMALPTLPGAVQLPTPPLTPRAAELSPLSTPPMSPSPALMHAAHGSAHRMQQMRPFELPDTLRDRISGAGLAFLQAFCEHTKQFGDLLALFDFEAAMRLSQLFWMQVPPEQRRALESQELVNCIVRRDDESYQHYLTVLIPSVLEARPLEFANAIQYFAKIYKGSLSQMMGDMPELVRQKRVSAAYNWSVQLYQRASINETAQSVRAMLAVPGRVAQLAHDWARLNIEPLLDMSHGRLMCNRTFIVNEMSKLKELIESNALTLESLADWTVLCLAAVLGHSQRSQQPAEAVTDNFMTHWLFFADLIVRDLSMSRSHDLVQVLKSSMEQYVNFVIQQYLREKAAPRPPLESLDVAPVPPVPIVFSSSMPSSSFPAGSPQYLPPAYQSSFSSFGPSVPAAQVPSAQSAVVQQQQQQQQQHYQALYSLQHAPQAELLQQQLQLLQNQQQQQQQQQAQQQAQYQTANFLAPTLTSSQLQLRQPQPQHQVVQQQLQFNHLLGVPAGSAASDQQQLQQLQQQQMLFGQQRDLRDSGPRAPSAPKKLRPQEIESDY